MLRGLKGLGVAGAWVIRGVRLLARMIKEVGDIPGTIFAGGHDVGAPFYILGDGNPPILCARSSLLAT